MTNNHTIYNELTNKYKYSFKWQHRRYFLPQYSQLLATDKHAGSRNK